MSTLGPIHTCNESSQSSPVALATPTHLRLILTIAISGGGLFGILGSYTNRWGRDPVVLLGMVTHFVTFLLIFYNLPSAAIRDTVPATLSHGFLFDPSK